MYATCLFCNTALGGNEALEHFPVGRRLAYDSATGRLWVVCPTCARWNLSPLETRWEAIEEAERLFRGTKVRVATDNVGLARLAEGTELVRIGQPPELEMAVWRYGDQFQKRYRKFLRNSALMAGAFSIPTAIATSFGYRTFGTILSFGIGMNIVGQGLQAFTSIKYAQWRNRTIPVAAVRDSRGALLRVTQQNINASTLIADDHRNWVLSLPHVSVQPAGRLARFVGSTHEAAAARAPVQLDGDIAMSALGTLLPTTNRWGASDKGITTAVELIDQSRNLQQLLQRASEESAYRANRFAKPVHGNQIAYAPHPIRLALEMTIHNDDERRAMEGELKELQQRWRDADAIAKIADGLLLPADIDTQLNALREEL